MKVWFFKTDWHSSNGRKVAEKFYDEPFEYLNDRIFDTDARNFYIGAAT